MEFVAATSQLRDVVTDVLDKKGVLARIKVPYCASDAFVHRLENLNLCS